MLGIRDSKLMEGSPEAIAELQAELTRLQRQCRLLVDDRKAYIHETEYTLRKQRQEIETLMQEENELLMDMKRVMQKTNVVADRRNTKQLKNLLDEEIVVKSSIEGEHELLIKCSKDMDKQQDQIIVKSYD